MYLEQHKIYLDISWYMGVPEYKRLVEELGLATFLYMLFVYGKRSPYRANTVSERESAVKSAMFKKKDGTDGIIDSISTEEFPEKYRRNTITPEGVVWAKALEKFREMDADADFDVYHTLLGKQSELLGTISKAPIDFWDDNVLVGGDSDEGTSNKHEERKQIMDIFVKSLDGLDKLNASLKIAEARVMEKSKGSQKANLSIHHK